MSSVWVRIDLDEVSDWASFHEVFKRTLGFFDGYGRNGDAWNDCMGDLDDLETGITDFKVPPGNVLALRLDHVTNFRTRCPEIWSALIEMSAFVNWRRMEKGREPILALSFYR